MNCSLCNKSIEFMGQFGGVFSSQASIAGIGNNDNYNMYRAQVCIKCKFIFCGDCITLGRPSPCPECNSPTEPAYVGTINSMGIIRKLINESEAVFEEKLADSIPITDVEKNIYQTVKIGTQIWMAENLRTTHYNDGIAIPIISNSTEWKNLNNPGCCWYDNDINKNKYGVLYNWFVVDTLRLSLLGWHVPTNADWDILQNYLIANSGNCDNKADGIMIAKALSSKDDWQADSNPFTIGNDLTKNNVSGFTALPAGLRDKLGAFRQIRYSCSWWSATENEYDTRCAYNRSLRCEDGHLLIGPFESKSQGFSIRLLKD